MIRLQHAQWTLYLHTLREAEGPPLLLLHGLGGSARDWHLAALRWPGPVHALDFSGHGQSDRLSGGAYHPEIWAADADVALAALAPRATLLGAGVGAYVALLVAGARPKQVAGAVLLAGPGLDGGGAIPDFSASLELPSYGPHPDPGPIDPRVAFSDIGPRPPAYAAEFARAARRIVLVEQGELFPAWWQALRAIETVEVEPAGAAAALERCRFERQSR